MNNTTAINYEVDSSTIPLSAPIPPPIPPPPAHVFVVGNEIQAFNSSPQAGKIIAIDDKGPVVRYLVKFNLFTMHSARWMTGHCILRPDIDAGEMSKIDGW